MGSVKKRKSNLSLGDLTEIGDKRKWTGCLKSGL